VIAQHQEGLVTDIRDQPRLFLSRAGVRQCVAPGGRRCGRAGRRGSAAD
jgi:hypothetical protein